MKGDWHRCWYIFEGGKRMDFNIIRTARAILHVTDLEASRKFYVDALAFVETDSDANHIYLRGLTEHKHRSHVMNKACHQALEILSYRVASDRDLEAMEKICTEKGYETKWKEKESKHAIGRALRVQAVGGLPLEFFAEMTPVERLI